MNLAELAERSAEQKGERLALDFEGERLTNFQILAYARRLHGALKELGVGRGDVVVTCMANHPLVFSIFQGIFRTGGTALPVMFMLGEEELRYVLSDARAVGVITDAANVEKVRRASKDLSHVRWITVLGGDPPLAPGPIPPPPRVPARAPPETSLPPISEDHVALMLYTSGTTGKPKGVMVTHGNLYASASAANAAAELETLGAPYILMSAMPMAHIFGVGVMNGSYLQPKEIEGYCVQMAWFEPERFMQLIQEHRCTSMAAVPTMLILILSHPRVGDYDLSSLVEVVCGAAPLPVEVALAFRDRFGCYIREIYGLTESTGIGTANLRSMPYKPGSAGRAYPGAEVQIFDPEDRPLPPGQKGEIVIRGPVVMNGYHNRPRETPETLRNGWLHTGDVGTLDEEGYLFVVDRIKDMIIKGGENIYACEVEEILFSLPGVVEAAVVGAPDPVYGETVVAFVVAAPGAELSEEEIVRTVKERISSFKAPSRVHFVDSLPKSPVGKILKRELRKRAADSPSQEGNAGG